MQIYKYTSSKEIIENAYRTSGMQNDIPLADALYWVYECMELIAYPPQYVPKVIGFEQDDRYDFTDWRVPLPCDFHLLEPNGIAVDGYPVRMSTDSFHYLKGGECCGLDQTSSDFAFQDNFGNIFDPALGRSLCYMEGVTYHIHDGWITFNVKSGKCCMAYWAFPVDENNFPLVPDDVKVKRAIADYLVHKMDYIAFRIGDIAPEVYKESQRQYHWSIAAAKSHLKTPDANEMKRMKDILIRLLPTQDAENRFFKELGYRERLSNR